MEVVGILVVMVGSTALMGGILWYAYQQEKKRKEILEAKGWTYTKVNRGFKVEGVTDGVLWEYIVRKGSGKNSSSTAMWRTPAEPSEDIVLVGPPLPEAMLAMGFSGMLVQFLAKKVLGEEGAADLGRSRELPVPDALRGKVSVVGTDTEVADAFLTEDNIQALLGAAETFRAIPAVLRWRDKLEVRPMGSDIRSPDGIVATVELGCTLARAAGYA